MKIMIVLTVLLSVLFCSCSRTERKEVQKTIDSASHTLGRDVDSLLKNKHDKDSVFSTVAAEKTDPAKLKSKDFRAYTSDIFDKYIDIKDDFQKDDSSSVADHVKELNAALMKTQASAPVNDKGTDWKLWLSSAEKTASALSSSQTLIAGRKRFAELSDLIEKMVVQFGVKGKSVYKLTCSSLKEDQFWFTESKEFGNPYTGRDRSNGKGENCLKVTRAWEFD